MVIIPYANLEKRRTYMKEYAKTHYDPIAQAERRRKYIQKYNMIFNTLKINGCAICGSYVHLEFAHSKHETKKFAISDFFRYNNNEIVEELAKCILLCKSCHSKIDNKILNLSEGKAL